MRHLPTNISTCSAYRNPRDLNPQCPLMPRGWKFQATISALLNSAYEPSLGLLVAKLLCIPTLALLIPHDVISMKLHTQSVGINLESRNTQFAMTTVFAAEASFSGLYIWDTTRLWYSGGFLRQQPPLNVTFTSQLVHSSAVSSQSPDIWSEEPFSVLNLKLRATRSISMR